MSSLFNECNQRSQSSVLGQSVADSVSESPTRRHLFVGFRSQLSHFTALSHLQHAGSGRGSCLAARHVLIIQSIHFSLSHLQHAERVAEAVASPF